MRSTAFLILLLILLCGAVHPALAQSTGGRVLYLTDWPNTALDDPALPDQERAAARAQVYDQDILPFIDTLSLGYHYTVSNDAPHLAAAVEWQPGRYGILDGRRVRYARMPDDVRLVALTLEAAVYVAGRHVADFVLELDSVLLGPKPDLLTLDVQRRSWDTFFTATPADSARRYFETGFALRDLSLVQVAFASFADEEEADEEDGPPFIVRRPPPTRVSVFGPHVDVGVRLGWLIGGRTRYGPPRPRAKRGDMGRGGDAAGEDRPARPTREQSRDADGEGAAAEAPEPAGPEAEAPAAEEDKTRARGRATDGDILPAKKPRSSDDRDDEDDDNELLPAALTALAAAGALAYAGGTVGYFGNLEHAPLGVSTGFVRSQGGLMIQVGVNEALLSQDSTPKNLMVRLMGFYDVFRLPLQPAVAVGVLAMDEGDVAYRPSVALGAVGNFGPLLLLGAYDLAQSGFEVGVAFNFRSRARF